MDRRRFVMTASAALLAGPGMAETYKGYEQPPYDVLWREADVELRRYRPHLVTEVVVSGSRRQAATAGFRALAGYIFGGNATGEKIAMTVPVTQAVRDDGTWAVRFMVPGSYSRERLPAPRTKEIRFLEVPGGDQLVARFSGLFSQGRMDDKVLALRAVAEERGLTMTGLPILYFYDDPMTLPWRRRNEVAFALA